MTDRRSFVQASAATIASVTLGDRPHEPLGRTAAAASRVVARPVLEHGGVNEVLADLSVDTGDGCWLALSRRSEHHAFTDALARNQDNLPGKHVNCQIPKLIGSAARFEYAGDATDLVTS